MSSIQLATRRQFITQGLGIIGVGAVLPSFLVRTALAGPNAKAGERILVVVQLSGGHDGLSAVVPYRNDELTRSQIGGSTELHHRQRAVADPQQREIRIGVVAEDVRVMVTAVRGRHIQMLCAGHNVTVCEDQAVGREDESGAGSLRAPRASRVAQPIDPHDGGTDTLDHADHRARIRIEKLVFLHSVVGHSVTNPCLRP